MQVVERDLEADFSPRVSYGRNESFSYAVPFSPLLLIESISRKSFSYNKLSQEPLKLTILKLDGSFFDIEVAKTARVAELKLAVETAFNYLPRKGPGKVSWSHVWGQFCLCYDGQKLLTDRDYIGAYGIKDGDQLQFIRHVSINYNIVKTRLQKQGPAFEEPRMRKDTRIINTPTVPKTRVAEPEMGSDDQESEENDKEYDNHYQDDDEDKGVTTRCQYKLAHLLRGWFSYRRMASSETKCEQKSIPSRVTYGFLGSF